MKDKQHERFQKIFYENLFLLNITNKNHELIFNVAGSTANVYSIKILKGSEWNNVFCNCHDAKKWAQQSGVFCKHIIFIIFKVLKLFTYTNTLSLISVSKEGEEFLEKRKLNKDYLEAISVFLDLFNIDNEKADFLNNDLVLKFKNLKKLSTNEDGMPPQKHEIVDKKQIGHCLICFDDFDPSIKLSCDEVCECSICESILHNNCLKKWFDHNKSCPLCRSKDSFNLFKKKEANDYVNLL
jgi:hypothetical protein